MLLQGVKLYKAVVPDAVRVWESGDEPLVQAVGRVHERRMTQRRSSGWVAS